MKSWLNGAFVALALGSPVAARDLTPGYVDIRVLDGDTIALGRYRVRLYGIDAPEKDQPCFDASGKAWACGIAATSTLADILGANNVDCAQQDVDKYGRSVAVCTIGSLDVSREMVRRGFALDYRQYSGGKYATDERRAKKAGVGMWIGEFEKPWDWRHR